MKVLVTGGAGFIGAALVRHILAGTEAQVINLDALTYAATPEALGDWLSHPRHVLEVADIRDSQAVDTVFARHSPDLCIHLAAESHVDRSIDGPGDFVATNITGTFHLLQAARRHARAGFRFHHVSTDEVFGSLGPADPTFDESTAYAPRSPYAASKAASDHLVRAWAETYGLPVVLSNCSNNYGPWQFPEKLIPVLILNALAGRPLPIYGAGDNVRDWLHVEDHARALWLIATRGRSGHSYNVGARAERTNLQVAHAVCAALDDLLPGAAPHAALITHVTDRPGHDRRYAINPARLMSELGWQPVQGFEQGLRDTVRWYLDNRAWWQGIVARGAAGHRLGLWHGNGPTPTGARG